MNKKLDLACRVLLAVGMTFSLGGLMFDPGDVVFLTATSVLFITSVLFPIQSPDREEVIKSATTPLTFCSSPIFYISVVVVLCYSAYYRLTTG